MKNMECARLKLGLVAGTSPLWMPGRRDQSSGPLVSGNFSQTKPIVVVKVRKDSGRWSSASKELPSFSLQNEFQYPPRDKEG
ncbi:hypothetical protein E2C01_046205 [Portunus trituberculatus]|uniref:Uncharacterized protein n=1 Tax=Portunus trituberculatus TaxID=210409 RepID=A0A5B7FX85_PORTR|nr:hypothetical protein [Portunus trituberculatus]